MTNTAPPGSPGNAPLDGTSGIGMCEFDGVNNVDKICLEYLGGGATYGTGWNGPYMTLGRNCCSGFTQYSNCTLIDLMDAAVATVSPVYTTAPNGNGATLFSQFTTRMWDHYLGNLPGPTGCAWWLNRYNHWSNQLLNLGPVINPFQLALKTAKIDFALLMITACDCIPAPPPQPYDMPTTPTTPTTKTYIPTPEVKDSKDVPEVKDSKDVVDVDSATLDKLIAGGADIEIL